MKNKLKILVLVILIIAVVVGIGYMLVNAIRSVSYNENAQNPVVTLSIEGYGDVQIELYPDYAPNTVSAFIKLIQNGYYDGKVFYGTDGIAVNAGMEYEETVEESTDETTEEVTDEETTDEEEEENTPIEDTLMLSDLDTSVTPASDEEDEITDEEEAEESDDYEISFEGEFVANGYEDNTLRFEYGTVGLYRTDYEGYGSDLSEYSYNSGTSLFFILTEEDSNLNGMYTAFGRVISGMNIIEQINSISTQVDEDEEEETEEEEDLHIHYFDGTYPVITTATVETYGIDYGMPEYGEAFDYDSWLSNLLLQYYQSN